MLIYCYEFRTAMNETYEQKKCKLLVLIEE